MDQELERISSESDKHKYRINVKQLIALIQDERMVRWIRNENSRNTVKTVDLALKLIHKIKEYCKEQDFHFYISSSLELRY